MMGEFFNGWRRKTGVLTLFLACLFTAGWIRSIAVGDSIQFMSKGGEPHFVVGSLDQTLVVGYSMIEDPKWNGHFPELWSSNSHGLEKELGDDFTWRWRLIGFGSGDYDGKLFVLMIPEWSIVIPLALLSAPLLIIKPRNSTPTIAPTQNPSCTEP